MRKQALPTHCYHILYLVPFPVSPPQCWTVYREHSGLSHEFFACQGRELPEGPAGPRDRKAQAFSDFSRSFPCSGLSSAPCTLPFGCKLSSINSAPRGHIMTCQFWNGNRLSQSTFLSEHLTICTLSLHQKDPLHNVNHFLWYFHCRDLSDRVGSYMSSEIWGSKSLKLGLAWAEIYNVGSPFSGHLVTEFKE